MPAPINLRYSPSQNFAAAKNREEAARVACLKGYVTELTAAAAITTTDEELAHRVSAGEEEVFAELYRRYYARAFRLAWTMTGQREAAEELTQEIFLRSWQKIGQFRGEAKFGTWFYRLATRCCLNYRQRRTTPAHETLDAFEERAEPGAMKQSEAQLEANLRQQELQDEVQRALFSLKPEWRLVVFLKDLEGLSYEEIAAQMNCSTGTVASRLNRARHLLAQKLAHWRGELM